ncbi:hypothetical protein [Nitrolancea hollandica]|uniref:Uncharacterized protein n=1 Tax=Nitrolancea hollandica Lb TaxID=1129897 RepID=I4EIU3_9BACT|nr:hypothetical protein [Nitrolancea hollandica]CCF84605.1 conserved exported hypothetical protein [Nitrolancea hollandica Lb]
MKRKLLTVIAAALLALGVVAGAGAQAFPNNWGQEVSGCNHSDCYPGGTSRGGYVSGQARDAEGPGYGWEIHNLANPGNSNPGGF